MRTLAALALAVPLALTGCQADQPKDQPKYSTGGNTSDSPCARVASAIGYAELMLVPPGQEERQNFEDAVISRIAEVNGITAEFADRLPAQAREPATQVRQAASALSKGDVPHDRQVRLLKQYRAATGRLQQACT
ncbi:hypothetical protein [Thermoactinospora rubra]|uniref:hypothetical protein n=1 Tax=Thermoactinospora rubra TaxID=1088767 RepID=UPI0011809E5F|nr:hypothetical protein [Thermoactinospora rubra]